MIMQINKIKLFFLPLCNHVKNLMVTPDLTHRVNMYTTSREGNEITTNKNYQHFKKLTATRGIWIQVFDEAQNQIMNLSNWEQGILIEDITTALQNRITIMNNANNNSQEMQHK
jgi:hypothetical protein